eukprot:COSAG02_NODE_2392_length_8974_cov_2.135437_4_plen_82_part_00
MCGSSTLGNGFLQNPSQRVVDGASGEDIPVAMSYHSVAMQQWGFPAQPNEAKMTTTDANDGMFYCANNLLKTSGNPMFGSE